jgi:hypothetical protein
MEGLTSSLGIGNSIGNNNFVFIGQQASKKLALRHSIDWLFIYSPWSQTATQF